MTIDFLVLGPVLLLAGSALLGLVIEAAWPNSRLSSWVVALLGAAGAVGAGGLALAALLPSGLMDQRLDAAACLPTGCLYSLSRPTLVLIVVTTIALLVIIGLLLGRWQHGRVDQGADLERASGPGLEIALAVVIAAATVGLLGARDVASWLILVELATLPAIGLVAFRDTRASASAAVNLLTTSLLSFALLALGVALWVVGTGTFFWTPGAFVLAWADPAQRPLLGLAFAALITGLAFKLTLVPGHLWAPPVFRAARPVVTIVLVTMSKFAAFGALLAVVMAFPGAGRPWLVGLLAGTSMLLGAVMLMRENDPRAFLAWSGITQTGWAIAPLAAISEQGAGVAAGYLAITGAASLLVLAVLASLAPARRLSDHAGLLRSEPLAGFAVGLGLLMLAGLPPALGGLVAKVSVLRIITDSGQWPLAVIAVISAVTAIVGYLRWAAFLLHHPGAEGALSLTLAQDGLEVAQSPAESEIVSGRGHLWVIASVTVALLLVVALSVAPGLALL